MSDASWCWGAEFVPLSPKAMNVTAPEPLAGAVRKLPARGVTSTPETNGSYEYVVAGVSPVRFASWW
jgi:hypothetical protein